MPVIPFWVYSLIITVLQKTGLQTAAEAWLERRGVAAVKTIEKLKRYDNPQTDYPKDKNSGL